MRAIRVLNIPRPCRDGFSSCWPEARLTFSDLPADGVPASLPDLPAGSDVFLWSVPGSTVVADGLCERGFRVSMVAPAPIAVDLEGTGTLLPLGYRVVAHRRGDALLDHMLLRDDPIQLDQVNPEQLDRAAALRDRLAAGVVGLQTHAPEALAGWPVRGARRRVLVVPDPSEGLFAPTKAWTRQELLPLARAMLPDAEVLLLAAELEPGTAERLPDGTLLLGGLPSAALMDAVDGVVTGAGPAGLDALLRGKLLAAAGAPLLSRAAAAKDPALVTRVLAAGMLLLCRYHDPFAGARVGALQAAALVEERLGARLRDRAASVVIAEADIGTAAVTEPALAPAALATAAPAASPEAVAWTGNPDIPAWFNPRPAPILSAALKDPRKVILFLPWIREHTDKIVEYIGHGSDYVFAPFDIWGDTAAVSEDARLDVRRFAIEQPEAYKRLVLRRLLPLRKRVAGFMFSFDWHPAMRIVAEVCRDIGMYRILIPHEGVFADPSRYYMDIASGTCAPTCDVALLWGMSQHEIFESRGYPARRMLLMGAPKFDCYVHYREMARIPRFGEMYGLKGDKPVVLVATQPLDSQFDKRAAREAQRRLVNDLCRIGQKRDWHIVIRLPPSRDDVLGTRLRREIPRWEWVAIDEAGAYVLPPEETIMGISAVVSINSTMLFEGALAAKAAVCARYVEFEPFWRRAGIVEVTNMRELEAALAAGLAGERPPLTPEGLQWAENALSNGRFDGGAANRIRTILDAYCRGENVFPEPMPPRTTGQEAEQEPVLEAVGG